MAKFTEQANGALTSPLPAFSGITSITDITDSTMTLHWTSSPSAISYNVYEVSSRIPVYKAVVLDPTAHSVILTDLEPDTDYKFLVRIVYRENNAFDTNAITATATTKLAPEKPNIPTLRTPSNSPGKIDKPILSVSGVKGGDTVRIYRDNLCQVMVGEGVVAAGASAIDIQVSSPLVEGNYELSADATNSLNHTSLCSNSVSYTFEREFSGITSVTNKTDTTATLNWTTSARAANYHVFDLSSGVPIYKQLISNPLTSSTTYTDLVPGQTYVYRVKMMTTDQGGMDSNTIDVTINMNLAPDKPSSPVLKFPSSSPSVEARPVFTVGGVKKGDTVKLYSNANCENLVEQVLVSGTGQTSVDMQLSSDLAQGNYFFSTNSSNQIGNTSACSDAIPYTYALPPYAPVIASGSASLRGSTGMNQIVSANSDDASTAIVLPFNFFLNNVGYKNWFVGSNTYITAGSGSTAYSSLGATNPALPKFLLGSGDNSYQRVYYINYGNSFRIRYEGAAGTSGTVGSPTIVYEFTFYRATETKQYVQVVFGVHGRDSGAFGVASASSYYANISGITINSSYVFESDLTGTVWTIYPNSHMDGLIE